MRKNRKTPILIIIVLSILSLILLGAIWYYYQVRIEAIDKKMEKDYLEITVFLIEKNNDRAIIELV